jgi:cell division protein FtsW (lipid II flippase)
VREFIKQFLLENFTALMLFTIIILAGCFFLHILHCASDAKTTEWTEGLITGLIAALTLALKVSPK